MQMQTLQLRAVRLYVNTKRLTARCKIIAICLAFYFLHSVLYVTFNGGGGSDAAAI